MLFSTSFNACILAALISYTTAVIIPQSHAEDTLHLSYSNYGPEIQAGPVTHPVLEPIFHHSMNRADYGHLKPNTFHGLQYHQKRNIGRVVHCDELFMVLIVVNRSCGWLHCGISRHPVEVPCCRCRPFITIRRLLLFTLHKVNTLNMASKASFEAGPSTLEPL